MDLGFGRRHFFVYDRKHNEVLTQIAAVEHETRRINAIILPARRISILPSGPFLRSKRIAPAKMVPIIDVKRERHETLPQSWIALELGEPGFGRRTTAAAFRRK